MKQVTIYTDGACSGNPGPGGWGAILMYGAHKRELSGGEADTTNNRMELTAVIRALSLLKEPCIVELWSDSKYVIDGLSKGWAKGWKAKGWVKSDKKPALNPDLWDELLGLESIVGEGFLRVGDLSAPMTAEAFADFAARQLGDTVRVMGHREALIHRVGLCSGGGCDEWADAHAMGADAFLTGEVKHHIALDASYHGVVLLEAGHFATENPGIFALMKALQNAPDIVQWKMHISRSERSAYE